MTGVQTCALPICLAYRTDSGIKKPTSWKDFWDEAYVGKRSTYVIGNTLGSLASYAIGAYGGRPLVERYGKYVLISAHDLELAERWFARFGEATVFFSRMLPIVRTFISVPAGIARMPLWRFTLFSVLGAIP